MIHDLHRYPSFPSPDISRGYRFFTRAEMLDMRIARSERYQIHGDIVTIFAGAADTADRYCFFQTDILSRHSSSVRDHAHLHQDETTLIYRGLFEFIIEGRRYLLKPGDVVWIPRGVFHSYRIVGDGLGTLWAALSPAGLEGFFHEAGIRLTEQSTNYGANAPRHDPPEHLLRKYGIAVSPRSCNARRPEP